MSEDTKEYIKTDFNLPCHDNELSKVEDLIIKLRQDFNNYIETKKISDEDFITVFENIIRVLDYVGRLSDFVFKIDDELEKRYKIEYLHAPELGKVLKQQHAEKLHHPYNILKNRCWKLLEELDELYIGLYDKEPPNWKI